MPTLWAHQNYFNNSSTVVPQALAPSKGGYPLWQASGIAVGSLFGALQPYWERLVAWLLSKWVRQVVVTAPTGVIAHAENLLNHPAYPFAQAAVRRTATTLGFNRPEAWQGLSRQMKSSPGHAENIYRHMQACQWTRDTAGSTLTNPECNLLVELAYQDFALKGK